MKILLRKFELCKLKEGGLQLLRVIARKPIGDLVCFVCVCDNLDLSVLNEYGLWQSKGAV